MKKENENEELQSRREFFKEAAKKTLPIIGAMILTSSPVFARAEEKEPMNCRYSACVGACLHACYGSCKDNCTSCKNSCYGGCKNNCTSCRNQCYGGCKSSSGK